MDHAVNAPTLMRIDADSLLRAVGLPTRTMSLGDRLYAGYALPFEKIATSPAPEPAETHQPRVGLGGGDPSVLAGSTWGETPVKRAVDMSFVAQVLSSTQYKLAATQRQFWDSVLPNGSALSSHQREILVKQALGSPLGALHAQMNSFMPQQAQPAPQPATQPPQQPTAQGGMPACAPGHQTMTGVQQRPIGLDFPQDTRAAALPGAPGSAGTNVIDQVGGLDPRGLSVDGNHGAGVAKMAEHNLPSWVVAPLTALEIARSKQAATLDVTGGDNVDSQAKARRRANGKPSFITFDELKAYEPKNDAERIAALQKAGHGPKRCLGCGSVQQCRCMREHHMGLELPEQTTDDCWECREKKAWIGVDLDGTLAMYDGWQGEDHIGDPVDVMVDRVKSWLADGKDVRIFTARVADDPDGKIAKSIGDWTEEHVGKRLKVTNEKDHDMEELWDDRAHRVAKNTGEKLALAMAMTPAPDEEEEERPHVNPMSHTPWLGMGLGAGALGAAGIAHGMASDQQVKNVRNAIAGYKPENFTQGQLPPNRTGLTHYQATLSPAAQLNPFGVPVGKALVSLRSDPDIMQALGTKDYTLKTPAEQQGVGGMAHYDMFSRGPVPAYAHQLNARLSGTPVPAEMGAPAGTMYNNWMGQKLNDFVAQQTGQRINPYEFTTQFMPHEDQVALMEKFHQSLPPEVQAYRMKAEDPGPGYANQTGNYLPKAKGLVDLRDNVMDAGKVMGGGAVGALAGNTLYDAFNDDDPTNDSTLGRLGAQAAGAGVGGLGTYLAGTEGGRQMMSNGFNALKGLALGKSAAVHPFRPVNADPDFIADNQEWHDAEKAKVAEREAQAEDPIYEAWLHSFMQRVGLA